MTIDARADKPRWMLGYPMAALLVILYWIVTVSSARDKSTTADEIVQLTGGYVQWKFHDARIHPQNGSLPKRLAALPLLWSDPAFPSRDQAAWQTSDEDVIGSDFFYRTGNDHRAMLWVGRAMIALLGVAAGLVVYAWSRQLFGPAAGIVSLVLFISNPSMIAFGRVIHADFAAMLFFTLSTFMIWTLLHRVSLFTLLASAFAVAGLMVSKMSAVVIVPVALLLVLVRLFSRQPVMLCWRGEHALTHRGRQLLVFAACALVHVLVSWAVVWAMFDFRYSAFSEAVMGQEMFNPPWHVVLEYSGKIRPWIEFAREYRLLPEAYLWGHAQVLAYPPNAIFVAGELMMDRPWYFLPYAMLIKTPLTLFAILLLAIMVTRRGWKADASKTPIRQRLLHAGYRTAPLWVLAGVYVFMSLSSSLNIVVGHRHNLTLYPLLFILAGAAAANASSLSRVTRKVLVGLLMLGIVETTLCYPNYLTYFNSLVGGSSNGYRHLVDSSLDWGQDLPALQRWIARHRAGEHRDEPVFVSFFGPDQVAAALDARMLPSFSATHPYHPHPPDFLPLTAGYYCMSATMLQQQISLSPRHWSADDERMYRQMRPTMDQMHQSLRTREQWAAFIAANDPSVEQGLRMFEMLRFLRLCAYLRQREPTEQINHSILVYRLTEQDLRDAMNDPVRTLP